MTNNPQFATTVAVAVLMSALRLAGRIGQRLEDARRSDGGQATAEYALVLLGAAAVALAVISWASRTNLIGKLLDLVFGGLMRKAG